MNTLQVERDNDVKSKTREEYEIQLYGFSLKLFVKENYIFVRNCILAEMNEIEEYLLNRVTNSEKSPDLGRMLKELSPIATEKIYQHSTNYISKINEISMKNFEIPNNVLLCEDRCHKDKISIEDLNNLEQECEDMTSLFIENSFFINALSDEEDMYTKILAEENYKNDQNAMENAKAFITINASCTDDNTV